MNEEEITRDWITRIEEVTRSGEQKLLTKKETAGLLRVHTSTVERMVAAGQLETVRIRGVARFRIADVSKIMREGTG